MHSGLNQAHDDAAAATEVSPSTRASGMEPLQWDSNSSASQCSLVLSFAWGEGWGRPEPELMIGTKSSGVDSIPVLRNPDGSNVVAVAVEGRDFDSSIDVP